MKTCRVLAAVLLATLLAGEAGAQRPQYAPEEFVARRQKLCGALGEGLALLFGASMPATNARFRQDNDFYYLTGNEDVGAVLVMSAKPCQAFLFLPTQNEAQIRVEGPGWLADETGNAKRWGFDRLYPLPYLEEFLARRRRVGSQPLWLRLSERDEVDGGRRDTALHVARRQSSSFGGQPTEDAWRIALLRQRYPAYEIKDVTPHLDALRVIKSPREIEVLRRNGKLSAEAVRRAIEATRAGRYEYELEAEATYWLLRGGAESGAYPAIVGSGANVNVWHYDRNERQLQDGELVVMDYGASLAYLTMDITRTWPVSGKLDELQRRAYEAALEAQKAIIAAMRPGATRAQTREIGRAIFDKRGFKEQSAPSAGHFVGLAVHDVGDAEAPFAPGMVIAVEPIVEIRDKRLHVRIEDTVLVTDGDPEILSAAVPKEIDELLALVGRAAPSQGPRKRH
jgi:Xaa-Pro aminopeptidase